MKWERDGAILHLYDLGPSDSLTGEIEEAERLARATGAACLYAEVLAGDWGVGALEACGFELDAEEKDVAGGRVVRRLSYLKVL